MSRKGRTAEGYARQLAANAKWKREHRSGTEQEKARHRQTNHAVRTLALRVLGGQCLVHGEDDPNVLVIDHVDGCERREGPKLYYDILKGRVPLDKYQVLCWNANHLKRLWRGEHGHR